MSWWASSNAVRSKLKSARSSVLCLTLTGSVAKAKGGAAGVLGVVATTSVIALRSHGGGTKASSSPSGGGRGGRNTDDKL